ncbi:MAG: hypothetical protein IKR13_04420 [Victivallales bacterium]|nr:hypothetical protein [Victivallales bacterium]
MMQVKRGFEIRLNNVSQTVPCDKTMRGIAFRHISGAVELTSRVWGNEVGSISDISFDDISFDYYGVGQAPYIDETGMWGRDSSDAAFEVKHASNVRFQNVRLRYCGPGQDGWKHGVASEDAPGLLCRDCDFSR